MFEAMDFTYDGISSIDKGVTLVNSNNGLFKESFLPSRKIVEKSVAGNPKPYFKRVEEQPLSFPITFYLDGWKERDNYREFVRWFDQPYYKPFWLATNPDRIMYALIEGTSSLLHNGVKDGYVEGTMRCSSPYMYSQPIKYTKNIRGTHTEWINNDGDKDCKPYLKIKKIGNGNIVINTFMEEQQINNFQINNLLDGEIIEVDCINEDLKSSHEPYGRFVFDNHNDDWIRFVLGNIYNGESSTRMELIGSFDLEMTYQMVYTGD